ncbi:hypothetical protein FS749_012051 [Ceratobasidium sp. UAMH 11750]|nr:hypothetical protein FS749_012051 [Ceratobasidium sp. UAMH 11750]
MSGDQPADEPPAHTSGYGLRRKSYTYSKSKRPSEKPPPPSTKRPAAPASAAANASKRARKSARTKTTEPQGTQDTEGGTVNSQNVQEALHDGASDLHTNTTIQESTSIQNSSEHPSEHSTQANRPIAPPAETSHQDPPGYPEYTQKTPGRHPDIKTVQPTPTRTNPRRTGTWGATTPRPTAPGVIISSPTPFVVRAMPDWASNFDDAHILNPNFVPNPNLPLVFPLGTQASDTIADPTTYSTTDSATYLNAGPITTNSTIAPGGYPATYSTVSDPFTIGPHHSDHVFQSTAAHLPGTLSPMQHPTDATITNPAYIQWNAGTLVSNTSHPAGYSTTSGMLTSHNSSNGLAPQSPAPSDPDELDNLHLAIMQSLRVSSRIQFST